MILRLLTAAVALGFAGAAHAACSSNGRVQICTDQFGNIFVVDEAGHAVRANRPEPKTAPPDDKSRLAAVVASTNERDQKRRNWNAPFSTWGPASATSFAEPSFPDLSGYSISSYEGGPE